MLYELYVVCNNGIIRIGMIFKLTPVVIVEGDLILTKLLSTVKLLAIDILAFCTIEMLRI